MQVKDLNNKYFSLEYDSNNGSLTQKNYIFIFTVVIYIQGSLNKLPDFFCMGTFIDSTHMKL